MFYRQLGRTGLQVSLIALGAGPVSGLMTGNCHQQQEAVLSRAAARGINWIDTAAGYGQGESERNLGKALRALNNTARFHLATKVRIAVDDPAPIAEQIRRSLDASLERLGVNKVTLLQVHNAITIGRGDIAAGITPADILGPHGALPALEALRREGRIDFIGLTGTGHPDALRAVIRSGTFDTLQVPYHVLNPSAGRPMAAGFDETDFGQVILDCAEQSMGVLAIRVLAAGALLGAAPSAHTRVTPFFPLELYERDVRRARSLHDKLPPGLSLKEVAVRYVLGHPAVHGAIIGMAEPQQVDELADLAQRGPLAPQQQQAIDAQVDRLYRGG